MTSQSPPSPRRRSCQMSVTKKSELYLSWAISDKYIEHLFLTLDLWLHLKWSLWPCFSFFFGSTFILCHFMSYISLNATCSFLCNKVGNKHKNSSGSHYLFSLALILAILVYLISLLLYILYLLIMSFSLKTYHSSLPCFLAWYIRPFTT